MYQTQTARSRPKFYPQLLSTEASFYIYDRPVTDINVIASVCALNLRIKFRYLLL